MPTRRPAMSNSSKMSAFCITWGLGIFHVAGELDDLVQAACPDLGRPIVARIGGVAQKGHLQWPGSRRQLHTDQGIEKGADRGQRTAPPYGESKASGLFRAFRWEILRIEAIGDRVHLGRIVRHVLGQAWRTRRVDDDRIGRP